MTYEMFEPRAWFFGFYERSRHPARWFGHCDMWGISKDEDWVFIDPQRTGMHVHVAHLAEEVEALIAVRLVEAHTIIRYEAPRRLWTLPAMAPMTCAAICGAAVGLRAWSPAALQRKLLQNGGEIRHAKTHGIPGGERAADARDAHGTQ